MNAFSQRTFVACMALVALPMLAPVALADAPACISWVEGGTYQAGAVVVYQGANYTALVTQTDWPGSGWTPTTTALWSPGGTCSGTPVPPPGPPPGPPPPGGLPPPPTTRLPQPYPQPSEWTRTDSPDGMTTSITTPTSHFPESNPFIDPTNLLPTVYANINDANGVPIPNTLPSTPGNPYNLMQGPPVVTQINGTSPADDLRAIYESWKACGDADGMGYQCAYSQTNFSQNLAGLQEGIAILQGDPVPDRAWSGIPMLHIAGADEVRKVVPVLDGNGNPIGGNVTVHYYYFDQHIEEDTAFIDPSLMLQPAYRNLPWTITYVVDVLDRGHGDFTPMEAYTTDPKVVGVTVPLVLFDPTFYPIADGTQNVFVIKQPPARFWSLVYDWGWRHHPGRIAVAENALKVAAGKTLPQWESSTFGTDPMANETSKLAAIAMIGDLAPAKRMWTDLRTLQQSGYNPTVMADYEDSYHHWQERNRLPEGVTPDPNAQMTLFYVNNTLFGQMRDFTRFNVHPRELDWNLRGYKLTVKLINGDYFPHAYFALDFGGLRGYENLYQNTTPLGGNGAFNTFGRAYWLTTTPSPVIVPAAVPGNLDADIANPTARALAASRMVAADQSPKSNVHALALAATTMQQGFTMAALDPTASTWPAVMPLATLPAANGDTLGVHTVNITLNYEPSRRMRIYQFDPLHHIQAIWTIH